jgi:hypothetical protein
MLVGATFPTAGFFGPHEFSIVYPVFMFLDYLEVLEMLHDLIKIYEIWCL